GRRKWAAVKGRAPPVQLSEAVIKTGHVRRTTGQWCPVRAYVGTPDSPPYEPDGQFLSIGCPVVRFGAGRAGNHLAASPHFAGRLSCTWTTCGGFLSRIRRMIVRTVSSLACRCSANSAMVRAPVDKATVTRLVRLA